MTITKAPLVSLFAQFVQGDIKGGVHAHAFRTATIRSAVEQMFKGNYSPITEAATLTEGKAKKARAYAAGFATFGVVGTDVKKVDYMGKLDSATNKEVRAIIDQKTHAATEAFFVAFDAVMAEKATPKEKAPVAETAPAPAPVAETAPAPAPAPAPVAELAPVASDEDKRHLQAVQLDEAVTSRANMIATGMLTGAQLDLLSDAMAQRDAILDAAMKELEAA
jgi:hypothetical protein